MMVLEIEDIEQIVLIKNLKLLEFMMEYIKLMTQCVYSILQEEWEKKDQHKDKDHDKKMQFISITMLNSFKTYSINIHIVIKMK